MVTIYELPIGYYVDRLRQGDYFAIVGYSDAEWFSIIKHQLGNVTGLGQVIDEGTGERLLQVLLRRQKDPNFLFALPKCIWEDDNFISSATDQKIESTLSMFGIVCQFFERDMVTDDLARDSGLFPFIQELQQKRVVVIGNRYLRELEFLHYSHFVEISCPNLHLKPQGIEEAAKDAKTYGKPAVYLVSAGVSAPLIIDQIYEEIPDSFFMDCGSIWDAFVGIGSQREWRRKLYDNPAALEKWKHDNLHGKES